MGVPHRLYLVLGFWLKIAALVCGGPLVRFSSCVRLFFPDLSFCPFVFSVAPSGCCYLFFFFVRPSSIPFLHSSFPSSQFCFHAVFVTLLRPQVCDKVCTLGAATRSPLPPSPHILFKKHLPNPYQDYSALEAKGASCEVEGLLSLLVLPNFAFGPRL